MLNSDQLPYVIALTDLYSERPRILREILQHYPDPVEAWERNQLPGKTASWQRAQQELI